MATSPLFYAATVPGVRQQATATIKVHGVVSDPPKRWACVAITIHDTSHPARGNHVHALVASGRTSPPPSVGRNPGAGSHGCKPRCRAWPPTTHRRPAHSCPSADPHPRTCPSCLGDGKTNPPSSPHDHQASAECFTLVRAPPPTGPSRADTVQSRHACVARCLGR